MGTHIMKTTVEVADALLAAAKAAARAEGTTLRALLEEGLQHVLEKRRKPTPYVLRDAAFKRPCRGLTPEFAAGGWDRIAAAIYDDDRVDYRRASGHRTRSK
jgi:hypothetical protein